ncbi:MAG: peptide-methionine (R)-S-oxide reductase [Erythrobacter sp. RIFCSPHIGHO2_12_FULL_63_10]|nr:MAG: peptide-methionine (R)-S-oxide reductase [Erythrobacter sp. RIFCSPHIGHO2_12_FULL_63_10]
MNRRNMMIAGAGLFAGLISRAHFASAKPTGKFEIHYSDAEWKKRLTAREFYILREQGTERPFTSELLKEKREGLYTCAGCALPVYRSADKFDSGTGWPSYVRAVNGNIGTSIDRGFFMTRTEVHCRRCGGHLGHVFDDGPRPTGKRHCINGDALDFVAAKRKPNAS